MYYQSCKAVRAWNQGSNPNARIHSSDIQFVEALVEEYTTSNSLSVILSNANKHKIPTTYLQNQGGHHHRGYIAINVNFVAPNLLKQLMHAISWMN